MAETNTFLQRLVGAAALDVAIYEDVEADRSATGQAMLVVLLSAVAAGLGSAGGGRPQIGTMVFMAAMALLSWAAWALVTYSVGAKVLPGPETSADVGELLRTLGFAATPGFIQVFGVLPAMQLPAFVIASVWTLAAMVVAVRQALDYRSTGRAIAVCVLGWLLTIVIAVVAGVIFGPTAH
jgi:Yip1 domain